MRISDWSSDVCSSDLLGKILRNRCRDRQSLEQCQLFALEDAVVKIGLNVDVRRARLDVRHLRARQSKRGLVLAVGGLARLVRKSGLGHGSQLLSYFIRLMFRMFRVKPSTQNIDRYKPFSSPACLGM